MMKNLLENEMPKYYNVGRRRLCDEIVIQKSEFDLVDSSKHFVVDYRKGFASFCNNPYKLSVVNYDAYIGLFAGTKMENGKRRCDFILTDTDTDDLVMLCEVTSTIGGVENLSIPITQKRKDGSEEVVFPLGKYQKVEMPVNAFNRYLMVEAEEAGENGAQISLPCVEQLGFKYFRISHEFAFKISE